jgi:hypothetical protein
VRADALLPIVFKNVQRETYIMTDERTRYKGKFRPIFLGHGVVNHTAGEYGRGRVHTNTRGRLVLDLQARHEGRVSALLPGSAFTAPSPSSSSATTTAWSTTATMDSAAFPHCWARSASGLRIGELRRKRKKAIPSQRLVFKIMESLDES